jgi:hypothetical protein
MRKQMVRFAFETFTVGIKECVCRELSALGDAEACE